LSLLVIAERRTFMFRTTLAVIGLLAAAVVASAQPRPDTGNPAVDQTPSQFRYRGPTTANDPLYRGSPSEDAKRRNAFRWRRHGAKRVAVPTQGPIPNQAYAACLPEARLFAGSRLTIEDLRDYIATHPQCAGRDQFPDTSIPTPKMEPPDNYAGYMSCLHYETQWQRHTMQLVLPNGQTLPNDALFQTMLKETSAAIEQKCLEQAGLQRVAGGGLQRIGGGR
jgi:hypothetical protein